MNDHQQLQKELHAAGASTTEIKELLPLASKLSLLKNSSPAMPREDEKATRWLKLVKPASLVAAGLALGTFLTIVSQGVLPTSWLFPVQQFSDSVAISIHPQYRAIIMMKRAQQVNQLIASHANSKQVLAALADYTSEARVYKSTSHANYAAFEYCKTNLQQAAASATTLSVRQAISTSLQSLDTT